MFPMIILYTNARGRKGDVTVKDRQELVTLINMVHELGWTIDAIS